MFYLMQAPYKSPSPNFFGFVHTRAMAQAMEVLLSAVASDLIGRLVSFVIRKYQDPSATDDVARLQRALLRAGAVVEEAEGRQIANGAMLLQVNRLRGQMCRGYYVLDAFRRRAGYPNRRSAASRCRLPPPGGDGADGLAVEARSLEAALSDMKEFVVLLGSCPRVNRQPYSAYLFMESCMFGRQMEKEQLIGFLLQPAQDLGVLPIIGPRDVGKRTLVEHVCLDERVRQHFAKIHRVNGDDLDRAPSHDHENHHQSMMDATARSLIVIDLAAAGDADEGEATWRRFRSSLRRHAHSESKVILISRAERHACLGTAPPLWLRAPRREELWYFFRALAFGAADPDERPELLRVAMALFGGIRDDAVFASAGILAAALRADLSARSWRRVLAGLLSGAMKLQLGAAGDGDRGDKRGCYYYLCKPLMDAPGGAPCLFCDKRKSMGVARSDSPKVTMPELLTGGAVLAGGETRFDVLVWQSRIPPFTSYVATCDLEKARQAVADKKRVLKRKERPTS
ncbi:hypothetical protein ACP70R_030223 [Stipagrostis hirtigluma subsp. patula]